jgi:hypothetical protein
MMTREQIADEVECLGLEMIALRTPMRELGLRLHTQSDCCRPKGPRDETAFSAYMALYDASRPLYSRGHPLKRFARALRKEVRHELSALSSQLSALSFAIGPGRFRGDPAVRRADARFRAV